MSRTRQSKPLPEASRKGHGKRVLFKATDKEAAALDNTLAGQQSATYKPQSKIQTNLNESEETASSMTAWGTYRSVCMTKSLTHLPDISHTSRIVREVVLRDNLKPHIRE